MKLKRARGTGMKLKCAICGYIHPVPCPDACEECKGLGVVRVIIQGGVRVESLGIKPGQDCKGTGLSKKVDASK
jgi:primosomal protein N'